MSTEATLADGSEAQSKGNSLTAINTAEDRLRLARAAGEQSRVACAQILGELGRLYLAAGRVIDANQVFTEAVSIARKLPSLADRLPFFLNGLGAVLVELGSFSAAEEVLREALRLQRDLLGPHHPALCDLQRTLAKIFIQNHNLLEAEALLRNVLNFREESVGKQDVLFAVAEHELGAVYLAQGNYEKAEHMLWGALSLRKELRDNVAQVAETLSLLGQLYFEKGNYASAEQHYTEGLQLMMSPERRGDPHIIPLLTGMAELHERICDYGFAMMCLKQADEIAWPAHGPHAVTLDIVLRQVSVTEGAGDIKRARSLMDQALRITAAIDSFNQRTDYVIARQAGILEKEGDYASAESFRRTQTLEAQKIYGTRHLRYGISLFKLASTLVCRGKFDEAENKFAEAADIIQRAVGQQTPDLASVLGGWADAQASLGRFGDAFRTMQKCEEINNRTIGQVFAISGEMVRILFVESLRVRFQRFLTVALCHLISDYPALEAAGALVFLRKGLALESGTILTEGIENSPVIGLGARVRKLSSLRAELARLLLSPQTITDDWCNSVIIKQSQKQFLEAEIVMQVPEMNLAPLLRDISSATVIAALPTETILIEYVRWEIFDFTKFEEQDDPTTIAHYAAFVFTSQQRRLAGVVDLGEAAGIERQISLFEDALIHMAPSTIDFANGEAQDGSPDRLLYSRGSALRSAIFDPLRQYLGNCNRLLVAPDAEIHRIPFATLPEKNGCPLIDTYQISYISCGRDLVRSANRNAQPSPQGPPVILAAPDFGQSQKQNRGNDTETFRFETFIPLDWTLREGESVQELIGGTLLFGPSATERALRELRAPRVLHIATHGFFVQGSDILNYFLNQTPMLRSGLALANANGWATGENPRDEGILTAEDVRDLALRGTVLVVLSACESGRGDIRPGEGVLGLRHALLLAGAQCVVTALWRIPDAESQELMVLFYKDLVEGHAVAEALRKAQVTLKHGKAHPLYWGAFIIDGDPEARLITH